jgi:pheromone shutdown-related protein TraB
MDEQPAVVTEYPALRDNIILVGTAHVSEDSVREVEEAIEKYRPDVVAVELDERRLKALQEGDESREINIKELLKGSNFAIFLLQWLLAYVQRKIGAQEGVRPGAEMIAAIEVAKKNGLEVALIDRDIGITLARFWERMSLREKLKMFSTLVLAAFGIGAEDVDMEKITNEDVVAGLVEELRHFAPSAATVLIDERDAYLAQNLVRLGREKKVLGIVGAGHREGIRKYLQNPEQLPPQESLTAIRKKHRLPWMKIFAGLCVLIAVLVFTLLALSGIPWWELVISIAILFIAKGVLSALFVTVSGGHRKSIAMSFALAWYSIVNPIAHIGWFAGVVEAAERPPTVRDLNTLLGKEEDGLLDTMKGLWNNKLFKVILVAAMANTGSFLGTLAGVALIVYYLHITDPVGLLQTGASNGLHALIGMVHYLIAVL